MTKKHLYATLGSVATIAAIALPMAVGAQANTNPLNVSSTGIQYGAYTGLSGQDLRITIANIIRTAMGLLGIIAVVIVLYGGFKWMTAAGDDTKVGDAKKIITAGIVGLIIIISAYAIASFIVSNLVTATGGSL